MVARQLFRLDLFLVRLTMSKRADAPGASALNATWTVTSRVTRFNSLATSRHSGFEDLLAPPYQPFSQSGRIYCPTVHYDCCLPPRGRRLTLVRSLANPAMLNFGSFSSRMLPDAGLTHIDTLMRVIAPYAN